MNNNLEKVYLVDFMCYTNCLNNTVSDWDGKSSFSGKEKYLDVPQPFLIKESDLDKYRIYGGGYRNTKFVGYMEV